MAAAAAACAAALIYFLRQVFAGELILSQSLRLGGFDLRYYGLILGLAVLAGYLVARKNAWRFGLGTAELDRYAFWLIVTSLVGARLYFVVFAAGYYRLHPQEIIQVWRGGLSIYGALISGLIFTFLFARKKIYTPWQLLDLTALALPLGQAIGRFGNFFNYEAYGRPTDLPWKMFVPAEFRIDPASAFYHPTFLYESLANLGIFFLLLSLRGKVKSGGIALAYLMSYALVRFCIEPLRTDSVFLGAFRADQLVSVVVFGAALAVFLVRTKSHT